MRRLFLLVVFVVLLRTLAGCGSDAPVTGPLENPPAVGEPPVNPPPIDDPPVEAPIEPSVDSLNAALIAQFKLKPLPQAPYPIGNRYNPHRVRLGRLLFFDPILGGESAPWVKSAAGKDPYRYRASDMACGTCHQPQFGFADGRKLGAGVGGGNGETHPVGLDRRVPAVSIITGKKLGIEPRNSMTILNTGLNGKNSIQPSFRSFMLMDGAVVDGLETQAFIPPGNRDEMAGDAYGRPELGDDLNGVAILDSLRWRVVNIPEYFELFKLAFSDRGIAVPADVRPDMILLALAAYERELVTPNSRYDQFVSGRYDVFTREEQQGFELFFGKGLCGSCHYGPMLSDYSFRCQGVGDDYDPGFEGKNGQGGDWGLFHGDPVIPRLTDGKYFFRVMTIRNVELTAPYFHSGSAGTLKGVVDFYNRGGLGPEDLSPQTLAAAGAPRDPAIRPLGLTETEVEAIVSFMRTTTAPVRPNADGIDLVTPPDRVPSGLLPPGVPTPAGPGPFYPEPRKAGK